MRRSTKYSISLKPKHQLLLIIFISSILLVWWGHNSLDSRLFTSEGLKEILAQAGWFAPFIYMSVLVISVVISQIPAVPLVMAAGMVWNPPLATLYSVAGGFLGGLLAYYLGRTLGRNALKMLTGKVFSFSKDKGEIHLGFLIFITRLIPLFSFDLISYASGFAGISLPIYASSTLLGMIPPTFLLTYMGSSLALDFTQKLEIIGFLLISTIIFIWLINRYNLLGLKDLIHVE
ncbi:TVP38/TMEM64 family protein [Crocosphaera sp. XPORK-15E]|uniref:TVP38/TMEM64 family protein n=1 Tax=Crocosphaera sp. XPORK-15E TaxID=3110247 RepID=UPI002B21EE5E|nr:TVP38/TMEM64 family protein [Crocosphaera sp. XPORK-15E]MEA5535006.1 TVP38/TMEM64 family protein [Crocosphaera sp. XPORK-15E]